MYCMAFLNNTAQYKKLIFFEFVLIDSSFRFYILNMGQE